MARETDSLLQAPEGRAQPQTSGGLYSSDLDLEHAANDFYEAIDEDMDEEDMDEDAVWLREQRHLNKSLHWLKRPAIYMIGVILFCNALAEGAGESTKRMLTFKLACNELIRESDHKFCDPTATELLVSDLQIITSITCGITALFAVSKIGAMSDKYGRKPFVIAIVVCNLLSKMFKYYVIKSSPYLRFKLMVLAEITGNMAGGLMALVTLCNCYVSDIAEAHQRTYFMGIVMAFLFVGVSVGPMVGNLILVVFQNIGSPDPGKHVSNMIAIERYEYMPLLFQLFIVFIGMLLSFFVLPESRSAKAIHKSRSLSVVTEDSGYTSFGIPDQEDRSIVVRTVSYVVSFGNVFKPLALLYIPKEFKPPSYDDARFQKDRISVIIIVICDCLLAGISIGLGEVLVLYGILKFNWNQLQIGNTMAISCASKAIMLIFVSPVLNHKLLMKRYQWPLLKYQVDMIDFFNMFIGLAVEGAALILYSVARSNSEMYLFAVIGSAGSLASPALNSCVVKYYPESKLGELFAAFSLVKNIMVLTFPVTLLAIYRKSISSWNMPGLVFLIAGSVLIAGSILILAMKRLLNLDSNTKPENLSRRSSFSRSRSSSVAQNSVISDRAAADVSDGPNTFHSNNPRSSFSDLHRKNSTISQYRVNPTQKS